MSLKWKLILGSIFFQGVLVRHIINGRAHVLFNGDALLASLKQNSERCECVFFSFLFFFFFCEMQEKRKIPVFPNGSAPSSGDAPKEAAHHAGPELQRTGRWVQTLHPCGRLLGARN